MRYVKACVSAAALAALAGTSMAQVALDGKKGTGEPYTLLFTQTNPTSAGDNFPTAAADASAVTTGMEFAIPLASIGNPAGAIKISGFINGQGHDFASNQWIGQLPASSPNLGEPRNIDLQVAPFDAFQTFIDVNPIVVADGTIVVNGTRDAAYGVNGDAAFVQANITQFGNSNLGLVNNSNGSELDNVFVVKDSVNLYVFIGGNLQSNFNKMELFLDTEAGGQNRLRGDNPNVDFNGLNRMGDNGNGNGVRFSAGFEADYWLMTTGNTGAHFNNYAKLTSADGTVPGVGGYIGQGTYGGPAGALTGGTNEFGTFLISRNESNTAGVSGQTGLIPSRDAADGSEVDGVWAYVETLVDHSKLHLLITGNLNTDYTKLNLFFDCGLPGQNRLLGTNPDTDFNGLNRMGEDPNNLGNGLRFDADFNANYWLSLSNGGSAEGLAYAINAAVLRNGGALRDFGGAAYDYGCFFFGTKATNDPVGFNGTAYPLYDGVSTNLTANYAPRHLVEIDPVPGLTPPMVGLVDASVDNNNVAGVTATAVGNPGAVMTGAEFTIDLRELGWNGEGCLKLAGFINSSGYDLVSNQVIGGLPGGSGLLGEPRSVDFTQIAGDQFVILAGTCAPSACTLDYNLDTVVNPDDLGDFITDYYTSPPIPGPEGYAIPCPANDPPYDQGYKAAFVIGGGGQCNEPFPDNLGDWITQYFGDQTCG
ncbi:MAG: hypothetical protein ACKVS8_06300 [Phycisphaerales bacterium]